MKYFLTGMFVGCLGLVLYCKQPLEKLLFFGSAMGILVVLCLYVLTKQMKEENLNKRVEKLEKELNERSNRIEKIAKQTKEELSHLVTKTGLDSVEKYL